MSVSVLIPAYRAAGTIAATVTAARTLPDVAEVIVIDDGSGDETSEAARAAGADQVLTLPHNLGKGGALQAGLAVASHETVLFLDSDLGDSAAQAAPLLEAVADRPAMSIAVFPKTGPRGGFGFAKGLATGVIRLFTGLRVTAPLSGQRALPTEAARTMGIAPRWGVEVALTVEAAHLGLPIVEQPVPLDHHHTGRDAAGFWHRFAQFRGVLRYALGLGYGLSWPALTKRQVWVRVAMWVAAFAALAGLWLWTPRAWAGAGVIVACGPRGSLSRHYLDFRGWPSLEEAMGMVLFSLLALVLWLPSLWLTAVTFGSRKINYLGRRIPGAAGLLIPLIGLVAAGLSAHRLYAEPLFWVLGAFGGVGLLDDLFGHLGKARGLRGHFRALLRGHLTTGAVKAIGGLVGGLMAARALNLGSHNLLELMLLDGFVIALTANLLNLLDLRPGRSLKGFLLLALVASAFMLQAFFSMPQPFDPRLLPWIYRAAGTLPVLLPALVAALVLVPAELSGRIMLGDVGANTLGAVAGLALVLALPVPGRIAALMILIALHLYCERASLTTLIARNRALRWLDGLGTRHLPPLPVREETSA